MVKPETIVLANVTPPANSTSKCSFLLLAGVMGEGTLCAIGIDGMVAVFSIILFFDFILDIRWVNITADMPEYPRNVSSDYSAPDAGGWAPGGGGVRPLISLF